MVQIVESEKEYEYELMQCRSCFAVSDEETDVNYNLSRLAANSNIAVIIKESSQRYGAK